MLYPCRRKEMIIGKWKKDVTCMSVHETTLCQFDLIFTRENIWNKYVYLHSFLCRQIRLHYIRDILRWLTWYIIIAFVCLFLHARLDAFLSWFLLSPPVHIARCDVTPLSLCPYAHLKFRLQNNDRWCTCKPHWDIGHFSWDIASLKYGYWGYY